MQTYLDKKIDDDDEPVEPGENETQDCRINYMIRSNDNFNDITDDAAYINHKQRINRISTSNRKERLKTKLKKSKNNYSRITAYTKRKSKGSKGRMSASRKKGSTSHSAQRKARVTPILKVSHTVRVKNKVPQLPPKSKLGTRKTSTVKKTTTPFSNSTFKTTIKPKSMMNEILKESTDNKFLEVIDCLRELRKRNFNVPQSSSLGSESTKSNRNLKTEIEFETSVVDIINAYKKCMDQVN
jgi:hypothetical protein